MNYYRFYVGDYLRDTPRLSILEHGAYNIMLHYYYAEETPLPLDKQEIYTMVRAMTAEHRKAVDKILEKYFSKQQDGYHNSRADEEISVATKVIATAKENGKLGGRPKKSETENETEKETKAGTESKTGDITETGTSGQSESEPANNHPPTSNLQPPTPTPQPPKKSSAAAETVDNSKATLRGAMSAALRAEGVTVTPSNPYLVQWIEKGVTIAQVREAVDIARDRKPKPEKIPVAYLDPIVAQVIGGQQPLSKVNGHDNGQWWSTNAGVEKKAEEEGIVIDVEGPERGTLLRCAVAAKIGPGPWIDMRNFTEKRIMEMYQKTPPWKVEK